MALVVLLRGLNVGGHRRVRTAALAAQLKHLGAVNIGAAGTFVIRQPVSQARVRAEFSRLLSFDAEMMICRGRDVLRLMDHEVFAGRRARTGIVPFVSVLARRPRSAPPLPVTLPARGPWLVRVIARDGRFVFGQYRRHMRVIGYLGSLDRLFGVPATTRTWGTITAIARALAVERRGPFG